MQQQIVRAERLVGARRQARWPRSSLCVCHGHMGMGARVHACKLVKASSLRHGTTS